MSEVQEPHPQPPKNKREGRYDVPHLINKRYIESRISAAQYLSKNNLLKKNQEAAIADQFRCR
ncbi:MAG: hypothetical protein ACYTXA_06905 [Nostoc sp.]